MVKGWHVKYYDPIGNRVSRIYNGTETRYIVDPASVVLAETDDQGNITAYYVYGLGLLSKITPSGDDYYYHYDAIGSTVAMTNSTGGVVNKYAYGIFGQIIDEQEQVENPFKYVGAFGVMDEENGLYFMRARYYSPDIGRFVSKDPIDLAGGINMYAYVGGNPINWTDPLGLSPLTDFFVGIGDAASFGITKWIRQKYGFDYGVDYCSDWYRAGKVLGYTTWIAGGTLRGGAFLSRLKAFRWLGNNPYFRLGMGKWPRVQGRIPTMRFGTGKQWWSHWRLTILGK